jgi:hypothetical protein
VFRKFEKAIYSIPREVLWRKLRRKRTSVNIVKYNKDICYGTEFCVKREENYVTDFIEQRREMRKGCSVSQCLFNMFIDDNIDNDVSLLGNNTDKRENKETLIAASKELGLEVNAEKLSICCCFVTRTQGEIIT